ncbi:MBL fold metallo-hydrolase [Micrococcus endophyticus]|uniref:Glyoxylase-like metal-dependent hydrolase (Beta-lactamase superfamily II) n=1 Tax=Micrococcus endophyticus TaxID=455343 RepID=A0A7W9JLN7_9MICC|nr:MBL fold metallo-hydrolase [Micrococcus endophyticus]MBB5849746.1 glyoxylase-like metal-dependent hydrolase (beta-lactamase superfamily II) [Micrococcus endophyticus]
MPERAAGWENGPFEPVSACGRVLVARCEPEGVNVGLVVGRERALLVDVGTFPAQGAALRAAADDVAGRLTGVRVGVAVLTHDHYDHWFGLAGLPDLEAWAHAGLGEPAGSSADWLPRVGLAAAPRPSRRIDDGGRQVLDLGGLSAVVEHHGRAHTRTDLTVLVPEAGVLFAGDLVEESGPPQHGPESDLARWPGVLDAVLQRLETPAAPSSQNEPCGMAPTTGEIGAIPQGSFHGEVRVVPGHGAVVDAAFVRAQREALAAAPPG